MYFEYLVSASGVCHLQAASTAAQDGPRIACNDDTGLPDGMPHHWNQASATRHRSRPQAVLLTTIRPVPSRSLAIWEKALGPEHPNVAQSLKNYAALLRKTGRSTEATKMEARAKAIRAKYTR